MGRRAADVAIGEVGPRHVGETPEIQGIGELGPAGGKRLVAAGDDVECISRRGTFCSAQNQMSQCARSGGTSSLIAQRSIKFAAGILNFRKVRVDSVSHFLPGSFHRSLVGAVNHHICDHRGWRGNFGNLTVRNSPFDICRTEELLLVRRVGCISDSLLSRTGIRHDQNEQAAANCVLQHSHPPSWPRDDIITSRTFLPTSPLTE